MKVKKEGYNKSESAIKNLEEKEGLAIRRRQNDVGAGEDIAVKIRLKDGSHGWSRSYYEVI